jgi:hypothetical protein
VASSAAAWRSGSSTALVAMMLMALLGMLYAGSMALYNGAMVAVCGFSAMLWSGVVAFSLALTARSAAMLDRTNESEELGREGQ